MRRGKRIETFGVELKLGSQRFKFPLCAKKESFHDQDVDHIWMDVRKIYGQRGRLGGGCRSIAEYYWDTCKLHGATANPENQQVYILARILPAVRSNAGRSIFCDARLFANKLEQERTLKVINRIVSEDPEGLDRIAAFNERTAVILGPEKMSPEEVNAYCNFQRDLFGDSLALCQSDPEKAVATVLKRWTNAVKNWGRRAGFKNEKKILNIISYECRAALHRCYSVVWQDLLQKLKVTRNLSDASVSFLNLWHLEALVDGQSVFHGHVFALHPGCSLLLLTDAGREILGAWLAQSDSQSYFALLNALFLSLYCYSVRREAYAAKRKKQPVGTRNLDRALHAWIRRKLHESRARQAGPPPSDDDE